MWGLAKKYPMQMLRGSVLGTAVGALPGAGADIAAWMSYAMSKKFSKEPEKFGTGHIEGIVESGAANNWALAGAWIPALVFGIPGDSITAIAIGVLYLKNMNPGPTMFVDNPQNIYAVFIVFILAKLLMLPLGWLAIKVAKQILRVPRDVLMPLILLFCIVGSFRHQQHARSTSASCWWSASSPSSWRRGFPVAPMILGVVLGTMLEEQFFSSLVKADGNLRHSSAADRRHARRADTGDLGLARCEEAPAAAARSGLQQVGDAVLLGLSVRSASCRCAPGRTRRSAGLRRCLYSPFSVVTGKPNITSFGMPYSPLRRHAHRHPLAVGAQRPVAHVVDRGVGGRGGRRQAARLDDRRAALAHGGQEGVGVPGLVVDHVLDALAVDGGEAVVGVHRRASGCPTR